MSNYPNESSLTSRSKASILLRGVVSYFVTSLVTGALAGVIAMYCYLSFILAPPWGTIMLKGDQRWETVIFVASSLLPISVIAGIAFSLIGFRFTSFRLRHRGVVNSCIALWLLITINRPMVSRVHRPGVPAPSYESVPDTMNSIVLVLLIVTLLSGLIQWMASRNHNSTPNSEIKNG